MNPLAADLDHVLAHTRGLWEELRGRRIFITGGTGFFGTWLLESFAWANQHLALKATAVVLTRNPEAFARKSPALAQSPAIQLHRGDAATFPFPAGEFSHVIHAAVESTGKAELGLDEFEHNLTGTQRVLTFSRERGVKKLLFTSSGTVYGRQPAELVQVPEDYVGAPSPTDGASSYGQAKRACEFLCVAFGARHAIDVTVARCFAFVGPHLRMDGGFAIGNFVRDALRGGPIHVNGDGTPFRSYLYMSDLAIWLWTILTRGKAGRAYNVGSGDGLTILELAHQVAAVLAGAREMECPRTIEVSVAKAPVPGAPPLRYVPDVSRARTELALEARIGLDDAILRTARWWKDVSELGAAT